MAEGIIGEIREKMGRGPRVEIVDALDDFEVKRGETAVFGADPKDSGHVQGKGVRGVKLAPGWVGDRQLSRAAVEVSLDDQGRQGLNVLTENNRVGVWYLDVSSGNWVYQKLVQGQVGRADMDRFGEGFIVDVDAANGKLVRLGDGGRSGGGGALGTRRFRMEVDPPGRDLNKKGRTGEWGEYQKRVVDHKKKLGR